MVDGEIIGTWRRSGLDVVLTAWQPLTARQRDAVEAEAVALPIRENHSTVRARWSET